MGNCGSTDPNISIHDLCKKGDVNGVRKLLREKTINPNGRDHRAEPFNTPLIDASTTQNLEVVRLLLTDSRVDPNVRNEEGDSALHYAVKGNLLLDFEIAELLLKDPRTTVHIRDTHDKKPFQYLEVSANKERFEKILKELNIDPTVTPTPTADEEKIRKSQAAPEQEAPKKHGLVPDDASDSPSLHDVCKNNDIKTLRKLLNSEHIDVNGHDHRAEPFNTPLIDAVANNNIEVVRVLLADDRIDPNYRNEDGNTALHLAIHGKLVLHLEIAELLLKDSRTSIHVRDKHDKKPFDYLEASANQEKLQEFLLASNIDIECKTPVEDQAKIMQSYHLPKVQEKKQVATSATAHDSYKLHDLAKAGKVDEVRKLLADSSIDVNGRDHRSEPFNTPFLDAAANQSLEVVRAMLEEDRVDVNVRNEEGQTALHYAVQGKLVLDLEIAELLLKSARVNKFIRDKHEKTAFDYLEASANKEKIEKFCEENSISLKEEEQQ